MDSVLDAVEALGLSAVENDQTPLQLIDFAIGTICQSLKFAQISHLTSRSAAN